MSNIFDECKKIFDLFDDDKDSLLSRIEYEELMKIVEITDFVSTKDTYTYDDFSKVMKDMFDKTPIDKDISPLFEIDDSGFITIDNAIYVMDNVGNKMLPKELDNFKEGVIINPIDTFRKIVEKYSNTEGKIKYTDFYDILTLKKR